jgi:hypothetical protein
VEKDFNQQVKRVSYVMLVLKLKEEGIDVSRRNNQMFEKT